MTLRGWWAPPIMLAGWLAVAVYGGVGEWSSCHHGDSRLFVRSFARGGILLHHSNCGGGVRVRSCVCSCAFAPLPPYIYIYIYIHVFLFIFIYLYFNRAAHPRPYLSIYIYIHVFLYIYIYLYFNRAAHPCVCVCVCVCGYVCDVSRPALWKAPPSPRHNCPA